jgi:hypothetical protein
MQTLAITRLDGGADRLADDPRFGQFGVVHPCGDRQDIERRSAIAVHIGHRDQRGVFEPERRHVVVGHGEDTRSGRGRGDRSAEVGSSVVIEADLADEVRELVRRVPPAMGGVGVHVVAAVHEPVCV